VILGAGSGVSGHSPTPVFSDNLTDSRRCGLSPAVRQIRLIADCDMPVAAAIERVDQRVASGGVCLSVLMITDATISSVMARGPPGRGLS
jgi:hypothetical protein